MLLNVKNVKVGVALAFLILLVINCTSNGIGTKKQLNSGQHVLLIPEKNKAVLKDPFTKEKASLPLIYSNKYHKDNFRYFTDAYKKSRTHVLENSKIGRYIYIGPEIVGGGNTPGGGIDFDGDEMGGDGDDDGSESQDEMHDDGDDDDEPQEEMHDDGDDDDEPQEEMHDDDDGASIGDSIPCGRSFGGFGDNITYGDYDDASPDEEEEEDDDDDDDDTTQSYGFKPAKFENLPIYEKKELTLYPLSTYEKKELTLHPLSTYEKKELTLYPLSTYEKKELTLYPLSTYSHL